MAAVRPGVNVEQVEAVLAQLDQLAESHRLEAQLMTQEVGEPSESTERDRLVMHIASDLTFREAAELLRGVL